jgi:hypothetical protein
MNYIAIDPSTGLYLRPATETERAAYLAQPTREPRTALSPEQAETFAAAFRRPARVGAVLVDTASVEGAGWHGGAGF